MNRRGFFGALVGGIAAATGIRSLAGSRALLRKNVFAGRIEFTPMLPAGRPSPFGSDLDVLQGARVLSMAEYEVWAQEDWSRPPVAPQLVQGHSGDLDALKEALPHHGIVGQVPVVHDVELMLGGLDDARGDAGPVQHHADDHLQGQKLSAEEGSLLDRFIGHGDPSVCRASLNAHHDVERPSGSDLPEIWPGFTTPISATAALPPFAQTERLMDLFGASGDAAPSFAAALIGELVLTRMRLADLQRLHAPVGLAS